MVPQLVQFVESLTNIYVRYNRDRLKGREGLPDCLAALHALFGVLLTSCQVCCTAFVQGSEACEAASRYARLVCRATRHLSGEHQRSSRLAPARLLAQATCSRLPSKLNLAGDSDLALKVAECGSSDEDHVCRSWRPSRPSSASTCTRTCGERCRKGPLPACTGVTSPKPALLR